MANPTQFETGATYTTRAVCNADVVYSWTVTRRTAKSVWLAQNRPNGSQEAPVRRSISVVFERETVYPDGRYSMCPVLTANDKARG